MTARARLVLASTLAVAGGAVAIAGARATWWVIERRGGSFVLNGRETRLPDLRTARSVADAAPGAVALAALIVVMGALLFFVGPAGRTVASSAILVSAAVFWVLVLAEHGPPAAAVTVRALGRPLPLAGAALAAMGGIGALAFGRGVARYRLPESGPDDPAG